MPKIKITEFDATGQVQSGVISNTVYLPVLVNNVDGVSFHETLLDLEKTVFRSVTQLDDFIKENTKLTVTTQVAQLDDEGEVISTEEVDTGDAEYVDKESLGYKLCKHLINIGFIIAVDFVQTFDSVSSDRLADKSLFDLRFLTAGAASFNDIKDSDTGEVTKSATEQYNALNAKLQAAADKRQDCVALLSAYECADDFSYDVSDVREAFESNASTYTAGFTPWFTTNHGDFGIGVKIPAAFGYLFAYANSIKNNPEWYAVAGFQRGIIPELAGVCHMYTSADVEILQARASSGEVDLDDEGDNVGVAINPICYVRPAGYILYGNRTLKSNDAAKGLTAQSFLNIRNGISAIKKTMYEAARKYTFEQNTETLWINFQSYITPLLDQMQSGNGILGYQFTRLTTPKKARVKARLSIVPVEAVEDFELEVFLTDDLTVSE